MRLGEVEPMISGRDYCIEKYIPYLEQEHARLRGGAIGAHFLACANAAYREWLSSGLPAARFRTWLAIRITCQWLSQLGERHERVIPPERTR